MPMTNCQVPVPPAPKRRKAGGNPYFDFQNGRMEAAKKIAPASDLTKAGALTDTARQKVIAESKAAWAAMSDEERRQRLEAFRERREAAGLVATQIAVAPEASADAFSQSSAWGMGTARCTVHPAMVQSAFRDGQRLPTYEEVFDKRQFLVPEPVLAEELRGEHIQLEGCPCLGTTVCRQAPRITEITELGSMLSRLMQTLGAPASRSCDVLVMLEGCEVRDPTGAQTRSRLFGLLCDGNFNPLAQVFTMCEVLGNHEVGMDDLAFPFDVRLAQEHCRLRIPTEAPQMCLHHVAGDEFAQMAVSLAVHWKIFTLDYTMVSIMVMRITGAKEFDPNPADARVPASLKADLKAAADINAMGMPGTETYRPPRAGGKGARSSRGGSGPGRPRGRGAGASQRADVGAASSSRDGPAPPAPIAESHAALEHLFDPEDDIFGDDLYGPVPPQCDGELVALADGLLMGAVDCGDLMDDEPRADDGEAPLEVQVEPSRVSSAGASAASSSSSAPPAVTIIGGSDEVADVLETMVDELVTATGITAAEGADEGSALVGADNLDGDIVSPKASAAVMPAAAAASVGNVASSSSSQALPLATPAPLGEPIAGAPDGWVMQAGGYVFDTERRLRCRITGWGPNVAIRIPGGASKAVKRSDVTDGELVNWMLAGFAEHLRPGPPKALRHKK